MHLTLKREATKRAAANALQQQGRFDAFVEQFNRERPHEALDMNVPGERDPASIHVPTQACRRLIPVSRLGARRSRTAAGCAIAAGK